MLYTKLICLAHLPFKLEMPTVMMCSLIDQYQERSVKFHPQRGVSVALRMFQLEVKNRLRKQTATGLWSLVSLFKLMLRIFIHRQPAYLSPSKLLLQHQSPILERLLTNTCKSNSSLRRPKAGNRSYQILLAIWHSLCQDPSR